MVLPGLIEQSYDAAEKLRFSGFTITALHLQQAISAAGDILRRSPNVPGACTYLNAMWTAMLRHVGLPAYCVAGDLCVRGVMAFGSTDSDNTLRFDGTGGAWDGHCWLAFGDYTGDLSLFRTAYTLPVGSNLRQAVLDEFGPEQDFLFMNNSDATATGFHYRPRYVANETEITGLLLGARSVGLL